METSMCVFVCLCVSETHSSFSSFLDVWWMFSVPHQPPAEDKSVLQTVIRRLKDKQERFLLVGLSEAEEVRVSALRASVDTRMTFRPALVLCLCGVFTSEEAAAEPSDRRRRKPSSEELETFQQRTPATRSF